MYQEKILMKDDAGFDLAPAYEYQCVVDILIKFSISSDQNFYFWAKPKRRERKKNY